MNTLRMIAYNIHRRDARKMIREARLKKNSEIILDLRHAVFFGLKFSQEVAALLQKKKPTRITILGGTESTRNSIAKPLMNLKVPIGAVSS